MSKIKIQRRPDLWYGKYDHCIKIWMHEASCLRDISGGEKLVRHIIQRRRDWGQRMVAAMGPITGNKSPGKQPGTWRWAGLDITEQEETNLVGMLEFLQSTIVDYRKVVSGDWMYLYSADPAFIDAIEALPFLTHRERIQRSCIKLQGTPGTVVMQEAKNRYRSYFRGYMKLTEQQNHALQKYLSYQSDVRLGPSLAEWVRDPRYYISDYFFIDHDDMGIVTMLNLMIPGIIRRTKPIETAK